MNFITALVSEAEPLELVGELTPETLALDEPAARAEEPIRADLRVVKDGEDVIVTGWLQTTLLLQCGRCTIWFPYPVRAEVEHIFEGPQPNSIDLTPFIREDILLELPLNAACRLGADGRCPVTGEVYRPRAEDTASLAGEGVWEALSKIKPKE
jgi:uncharacterized metal-binding protein YceD (DUF177 family)